VQQAVLRMSTLLKDFKNEGICDGVNLPRCICYCLTHKKCEQAVEAFRVHNIDAHIFSSKSNREAAIKSFTGTGGIQVLCATSALGRGVHIECPVRFIFHLVMPATLAGKCCIYSKALYNVSDN
jgi:superfamily II DNA helicase RecQ